MGRLILALACAGAPHGLHAYHKAEIDKWWPVIKAANIKVP